MEKSNDVLDSIFKSIQDNVDLMVFNLYNFDVSYVQWIEFCLEYNALKRYNYYGELFRSLSRDLGHALINASVSCTKEEEHSYTEWCFLIERDLGISKTLK